VYLISTQLERFFFFGPLEREIMCRKETGYSKIVIEKLHLIQLV